ncbi:MAG: tripartite tricarboxylate transporter permease [Planctomycetota bacterium]|jgi:putative tricarboxylic transport membrane protein|nr:tripartite tricarboxylate transporter permease [Planctomycetota bacterium]
MSEWLTGFWNVMDPGVLLFLGIGVLGGMVIGALPGLTATMGVAILTPLTFWFEPTRGFAMLIGVWNSAIFAGGITAILINTPGTPASIASTFDGYALYKQGKGGLALGINVIYSAFGGIFGTLVLIFFSFPLARFTIGFGATEYFGLAFFGLTMMAAVSSDSVLKGMIAGFAGILFSTIGIDPMLAMKRFTLGSVNLIDGVQFLPVMIGMFGVGEVLNQIFEHDRLAESAENARRHVNLALGRVLPNLAEIHSASRLTTISAMVGAVVGAIPAAGGDIASIICWGQARKWSKHPEEYGKGSLEGLAVSTVANNSVLGGALTTMLTLGIPGDAATAVLIGSLMMYGMQPGPKMFTEAKPFVINIMLLMLLANLAFLAIGLVTAKASAKVLAVNPRTVWVSVCLLCVVGSFALNNNSFDVGIMFASGILGFVFRRTGYAPGPFILGLLLGRMLEANLRRALVISQGSYLIFLTRPISCILLVLTVLTLLWPLAKALLFRSAGTKTGS